METTQQALKKNPTHTYKAGTYTVNLTVRGYGVTSTRTMMLEVMLATIHVNSTAVTFLGQTLNLTFKIPLNNTAKWISIGAMATGPFNETVFLVEDGVAYKLAELTNPFYQVNRQSQREIVWTATAGLNRLIEICTKLGLDEFETINEYLNNFNLTGQEKNFILTNHGRCIDILQVNIEYPGEESVTIANITFPGNRSTRTLLLLYTNGYYIHPPGETAPNIIINDTLTWEASNYDAIITYTIATKKITNQTLQYWLNKEYPPGPLKAAYGLFLAGLETIYLHDLIADQAAAKYNTTWTRTKPAMVSAGDHSPATWISLECNHNMGVKANGTTQNLKAFNYARTSTINPIEYYVMEALFPGSDPTTAPITGIGQKLLNGEPLDILETENYTLITDNQGRYIIIDHKTGIVRDIIYNLMGAYCYYHQQTELAKKLGNEILNGSGWWKFIGVAGVSTAEAAVLELGVLSAPETLGLSLAVTLAAYIIMEHPEWLPYIKDAAIMTLLLTPAGIHLAMAYAWLSKDATYFELLLKKITDPNEVLDNVIKELQNNLDPNSLIGPDGKRGNILGFFRDRYVRFYNSLKRGDIVGVVKYGIELITGGITVGSWAVSGFKEFVKAVLEKETGGG
ncbi:MAG: hypothetical protein QFX38_07460 [Methanothermobacter sp.]|nr:hypothetical protein [Methanothermobacter sp.]